jgi:hypothetical protein
MPASRPLSPALAARAHPLVLWTEVALTSAEMLWSSAVVIATRLDRMLRAGPNPSARDRREFTLMGTEKLKAATQSAVAVGTHLQRTQLALALGSVPVLWQPWWQAPALAWGLAAPAAFGAPAHRPHTDAVADLAHLTRAALKPIHAAATANARRLARVRTGARRR